MENMAEAYVVRNGERICYGPKPRYVCEEWLDRFLDQYERMYGGRAARTKAREYSLDRTT